MFCIITNDQTIYQLLIHRLLVTHPIFQLFKVFLQNRSNCKNMDQLEDGKDSVKSGQNDQLNVGQTFF